QEATSLPFTACRKAAHSVPPNTRCPVPGFLESRTADRPGRAATSTQSPWEPLWVDFFQHSPSSGKRGFNAWFLSLPVFLEDALQQRPRSAAFFGGSRLDLLETRRVLRHFILVRGELTGVLSFDVNRGEVFRLDSKYDERGAPHPRVGSRRVGQHPDRHAFPLGEIEQLLHLLGHHRSRTHLLPKHTFGDDHLERRRPLALESRLTLLPDLDFPIGIAVRTECRLDDGPRVGLGLHDARHELGLERLDGGCIRLYVGVCPIAALQVVRLPTIRLPRLAAKLQ